MLLAAEPAPLFTPPLLPEVGCVHVCVGSKAPPPFSISFIHLMKSESPCWYQCLEEGWNLHDLDLGLCRAGLISLCSSSWLQAGRTAQLRQSWEPPGPRAFSLALFRYQTSVLDSSPFILKETGKLQTPSRKCFLT